MCIYLKIYLIIFDFFCMFLLEHFDIFLNVFAIAGHIQYGFSTKYFRLKLPFLRSKRKKDRHRFHPPTEQEY